MHHIFPRSLTKSDSYFVEIETDFDELDSGPLGDDTTWKTVKIVTPHAVGLCGSGTTGHHGDVEEHRAWIKLEGGEYVWYDRIVPDGGEFGNDGWEVVPEAWVPLGALNPQPGSVDGKPKRKRTVKGTSERAQRKTISVRLPEDVSGEDWDDLLEEAERVELEQPDTKFDKARGSITVGKLLVAVLERFTGRVG